LARTPLQRLQQGRLLRGRLLEDAPAPSEAYNGHILIVGFGVTGHNLAYSARRSNVPYAVVEVNAGIVKEARAQGEPIHYGDASQPPILELVHADRARAIVVVIDDPAGARRVVELCRRFAPDAYVLVRSRYLREVEALMALGADEVIADELEVSIEVFSRVLARMLVPREDIKAMIGDVRGDWRRMTRGLAKEATAVHDLRVAVPNLATHSLRLGPRSPLLGATIATSRLREDYGVNVLAVTRSGEAIGNPPGELAFQQGDVLFVIGPTDWDADQIT